jgi:hypothetical protein
MPGSTDGGAHRGVRPRAMKARGRPTGRLQSMLQALFRSGDARRTDNQPEPDCVNCVQGSGGKVYCAGPPAEGKGAAPPCVGRGCGYYESETPDVEESRSY